MRWGTSKPNGAWLIRTLRRRVAQRCLAAEAIAWPVYPPSRAATPTQSMLAAAKTNIKKQVRKL
jgi:hypothetical protein